MPQTRQLKNMDADTRQELRLALMELKAVRERNNADLDALAARINRLLPHSESNHSKIFKNFTKQQWGDYLNGKISLRD